MLRFWVRAGEMKRSLRFPLVLLVLVAAALSCRSVGLRGFTLGPRYDAGDAAHDLEAVNETLFLLSAAEPGAAELQQNVADLLSANLESIDIARGRFREISLWRRGVKAGERSRSLGSLRFPAQPDHPEHGRVLPEFRRLLADWFRNRRQFRPEVMSELVDRIKRPIDRSYGYPDTGRPYATCAVVGNSGILLKAEHGDLIDGHDLVIRLNNARMAGYQRHIGVKTSLSFINSNVLRSCAVRDGCFCHPYGDSVPIVFYLCQPAHFVEYLVCNSTHKSPLLVTDGRFDTLCARIVKYYSLKLFVEETGKPPAMWGKYHDVEMFHYSSGMQAVVLALGMCDKVSAFGFGKSPEAKHHYHTNQRAELGLHDYPAEYEFYRDLVERPQAIPFLRDAGIKLPSVSFYH
ncbi:sialyltransferase-like protein 3 [Curcuma longa]|uniref:sialyltransferase-like protein 3 n=1 Tax=Curcuma longa TaxID=136217 RepID=UPI003D9E006E